MDNYYSLPKLFLELVKRKTDAVGTARLNRKSLPLDFKNVKLKKGEQIVRYYKTMIVQEIQSQVEKPTCVQEYNNSKYGTNITNKMLAPYCIPRQRLKKY
jgi:hypothetical protein